MADINDGEELVDESYIRVKLQEFCDSRLAFYCHHITCYGKSNLAFSFDVLIPAKYTTINDLGEFMYNKEMRVPCSGIAHRDDYMRSCTNVQVNTITYDSSDTAKEYPIYSFHIVERIADNYPNGTFAGAAGATYDDYVLCTDGDLEMTVWEV